VFPGNEWLWDAFVTLNTCRSSGMDAGQIPWTAADRYAERHDIDLSLLWAVIHKTDTAFRAYVSSKS
jgi:hypothetical protein